MKEKSYTTPTLKTYGNVEDLTKDTTIIKRGGSADMFTQNDQSALGSNVKITHP